MCVVSFFFVKYLIYVCNMADFAGAFLPIILRATVHNRRAMQQTNNILHRSHSLNARKSAFVIPFVTQRFQSVRHAGVKLV